MKELVQQRRQALERQRQQLQQRMAQLQQQRQGIDHQIQQTTADLNAVHGAVQLCDSLLQEAGGNGPVSVPIGMEELGEVLDADAVEFVDEEVPSPEDGD